MTPLRSAVRAAALLAALGVVLVTGGPVSAAGAPYTDPAAKGSIGLCDKSGKQVTSGSTEDLPLAWTAASTVPAPAGYTDPKSKATLYAYQPRKDVDPGEWSGAPLTGSSYFSSPAHPMAAFTTGDKRLHDLLQVYPARWSGLVQLRLFFSGPNRPALTQTYPAANLQVTGTSWHQIDPPTVSCTAGKSVSVETLYLPASRFPTPTTATPSPATTGKAGGSSNGSAAGSAVTAGQPAAPSTGAPASSSGLVAGGLLGAAVLGLGLIAVFWLRNRRAP